MKLIFILNFFQVEGWINKNFHLKNQKIISFLHQFNIIVMEILLSLEEFLNIFAFMIYSIESY